MNFDFRHIRLVLCQQDTPPELHHRLPSDRPTLDLVFTSVSSIDQLIVVCVNFLERATLYSTQRHLDLIRNLAQVSLPLLLVFLFARS